MLEFQATIFHFACGVGIMLFLVGLLVYGMFQIIDRSWRQEQELKRLQAENEKLKLENLDLRRNQKRNNPQVE